MTSTSVKCRNDASWHLHATWLGLLALGLAAASPSPALAAGADEICGRIDSWSDSCDEGLACELILRWHDWSIGKCVEVPVQHCGGDLPEQCDETAYCAFEEAGACGFADEPGVCEPRPQVCTEQYAPVCGCDGTTYGNACFAHAAGTAVQSEGPCEPEPNTCDYEDPVRSWVSTDPEQCTAISFLCIRGKLPFSNECGCGCEPACRVAGCSGQLCVGRDDDGISTCIFREEYACYEDATCTLQPDGECGFTPTRELEACIERARASEP